VSQTSSGVHVGKYSQALLCSIAVALSSLTFAAPSKGTSRPILDYCANISTGQIHPVTSGSCSSDERSLGLGKLVPHPQRPQQLDPQLAARFNAARTVGASHGYTVEIRSGWRSVNHQQHLFNAAVTKYGSVQAAAKWVLPPKDSMHTFGLAIDVKYSGNIRSASFWFQKYSAHFGLCRRYQNEWWHYEPLVSPGQPCPALESSATRSLHN